jgi:hypothetical protein
LNPQQSTNPSISTYVLPHSNALILYLVDILALELRDECGETLVVSFDTDGLEDGLDILGGRRGVATDGEEKVCREVLHVGS